MAVPYTVCVGGLCILYVYIWYLLCCILVEYAMHAGTAHIPFIYVQNIYRLLDRSARAIYWMHIPLDSRFITSCCIHDRMHYLLEHESRRIVRSTSKIMADVSIWMVWAMQHMSVHECDEIPSEKIDISCSSLTIANENNLITLLYHKTESIYFIKLHSNVLLCIQDKELFHLPKECE